MLDENVSPAADQPDARAVRQPLATLVTLTGALEGGLLEKGGRGAQPKFTCAFQKKKESSLTMPLTNYIIPQ